MARYFTLEEATALLPRLRAEIAALQSGTRELAEQRAALAALMELPKLNGRAGEAGERERRIAELLRDLGARLDALTALGIEVKNLDDGLVDFPHWRDGRVVYLCWRVEEERIAYWHETDAGFRGRQPL